MKRTKMLFLLAFICLGLTASAQKFGHMNSGNLLEKVPEMKAADSELQAYQEQLMKAGQAMVKSFETKYTSYATEAQGGTLSRVQIQAKEGELQAEQTKIQEYEKEVQLKILKKREELLKPILEKIDNAINAVGKENGYTMIFDTSLGAMLFAPETEDVEALVLKKLGM